LFFSIINNIEVNPCHLPISLFEELPSPYSFVVKSKLLHFIAMIVVELKHETQRKVSDSIHVIQYTMTQATGLMRKFGDWHMMYSCEWLELGGGKLPLICELDPCWAF
jgi:hypothetical protein